MLRSQIMLLLEVIVPAMTLTRVRYDDKNLQIILGDSLFLLSRCYDNACCVCTNL